MDSKIQTTAELPAVALRVLAHEALALEEVRRLLDPEEFIRAVRLIVKHTGAVVTTGVGKSALVAQRVAAVLRVSGVSSWFLHPVDALHGDVGGLNVNEDILLVCSRSGESTELEELLCWAQEEQMPVVAITAGAKSTLAEAADAVLLHGPEEACQHGLTPTSTVAAAGGLGDALALALQVYLGFSPEDFAALHKNGILGRRLTLKVTDVMVTGDAVGRVLPVNSILEAMMMLARKRGTLVVESPTADQILLGVLTAGDVARYLDASRPVPRTGWELATVVDLMSKNPYRCTPEALVVGVIEGMQEVGIMAMPVVDAGNHVLGMIHLHDALRARVQ